VLHAVGQQQRLVRQALIAAVVNVALAATLIPGYGALGAAFANIAAQALASVLAIRAAMHVSATRLPTRALVRGVGAALVMGIGAAVAAAVVGGLEGLVVAVVAGAAVYPLALRALGALTAEDLDRARAMADRLPRGIQARALGLAAFLCRGAAPATPSAHVVGP
jgi:O-antigen/teichoic acid export membrane protein